MLQNWGVLEEVLKYADRPKAGTFRSYRGDVLSQSPPVSDPRLVKNAPYIVIHRADLLRALLSGTRKHKIEVRLGSDVKEINFSKPFQQAISASPSFVLPPARFMKQT